MISIESHKITSNNSKEYKHFTFRYIYGDSNVLTVAFDKMSLGALLACFPIHPVGRESYRKHVGLDNSISWYLRCITVSSNGRSEASGSRK